AVHRDEQPLTSVEFECGDGNYGNNLGNRHDPSSVDFKFRMCLAQGNRLINFYLFSGGHNYRLNPEPQDGDGRMATTGERHGFAAPVGPEGKLNYTYARMARAIKAAMTVSNQLATMKEEHDRVVLGFIPDYYMTEYRYPGNDTMREICANLEANRGYGAWEIMIRAMLHSGFRFTAQDIQNRPLDPSVTPVIALGSARYMGQAIQRKLVIWLEQGGGLLLYGEVPRLDMEGQDCLILANALGIKIVNDVHSAEKVFLSIYADGWAAPRPEIRTHYAQVVQTDTAQPLFRLHGSNAICGFETTVGSGRAIVIATAYECDIPLFNMALQRLGAVAGLTHDCPNHGIFMTSTSNDAGERIIHMLNLDGFEKSVHIRLNGKKLLGGRKITLQARDAVMLPFNMTFHQVKIHYSSAELSNITRNSLEFRLTQDSDFILLETSRKVLTDANYHLRQQGNRLLLTSKKNAKIDGKLTVRFK
ncbi:MAG: glycosyl hydrolase, partial [Candidatus Methylumidiphilus sp.]